MKSKLTSKNKKMYSELLKLDWFVLKLIRYNNNDLVKYKYRYNSITDVSNARFMFDGSDMITVPILLTSKNRRSRIKNKNNGFRVFRTLKAFNSEFNLNLKKEDLYMRGARNE